MSFDSIASQLEDGVIKILFQFLNMFITVCSKIAEVSSKTLEELLIEVLQWAGVPDFQTTIIDVILDGPWAFFYHITIADLLLGGALIAVIVFGIVKYFTDIIL